MKKIVRLTEKDINMLVKKIIRESDPGDGKKDDFSEYEGRTDIYADNVGVENKDNPEQNLTERDLTRLVKRVINEDKDNKKMDLKSDFNDIINHEYYSEIDSAYNALRWIDFFLYGIGYRNRERDYSFYINQIILSRYVHAHSLFPLLCLNLTRHYYVFLGLFR